MSSQTRENMIIKTGWGLCHYFIIGLCMMSTMAEATASLIVCIAMTLLACDLNYNQKDVMTLNAASSLGMAVGSLLFGTLADYNGRKSLIPMTMIIIFCASIGLSFSQTYFLINFSIFILGMGTAGNNVTLRIYLIECLPARKRGSCLALIDLVWIIGYLLSLGVSWSLIPSVIRMIDHKFRPSSWRVLVGLAGAPSLIMACATGLLPSSPRYLIYRRRLEQALAVLQQMFAINNSQHMANCPSINLHDCSNDEYDDSSDSLLAIIKLLILKTWRRIMFIFSLKFIGSTLLLTLIRLFLFPGFMSIAIWKTHVFTHQSIIPVNSTSINNQTCNIDIDGMIVNFLDNCHQIDDIYLEYLMLFSSSFIIGELLLVFGIDIIGRRLSLVTSGLIGATSMIALPFANRHHAKITLSIFFCASYSIINTTTNIIQLENYPTAVRGTIVGLTSILPHLTSFFIKLFVQITCMKSLYIASGLLIGATIAAIPIPDLANVPMQE